MRKRIKRKQKLLFATKELLFVLILIGLAGVDARSQSIAQINGAKTFVAVQQTKKWDGWARDEQSIPGWGNQPPEPGTVTIIHAGPGQPRTFSGRVDGLENFSDCEVGVVSLTYIYWNRKDAYHWIPLGGDGTFSISDDRYLNENKSVVLRAPHHPWTFLRYIFKGDESGKDIVLHAEPGKAVRVTMDVDGKPCKDFGIECFMLNKAWIHANNPLGYQWASRGQSLEQNGESLTLDLPLCPIAVYVSADGGANDWQIVDARDADHFHFSLLPAARLDLTVTSNGSPAVGSEIVIGNENAALSLRSGQTDGNGKWTAGRLAPGTWWLTVKQKASKFSLSPKQIIVATYDLDTGTLVENP